MLAKINTKLSAILLSVSLMSCGSLVRKDYTEPVSEPYSSAVFSNHLSTRVGFHIYTNGENCSDQRRVVYLSPEESKTFRIPANKLQAYSLHLLARSSVIENRKIEMCTLAFSFTAGTNRSYKIDFSETIGSCSVYVEDSTSFPSKTVSIRKREYIYKDFSSDDFCIDK